MLFNSPEFIFVFLPVTLIGFFVLARANAWLEDRLAPLARKLRLAERAVADFRAANGLIEDRSKEKIGEYQGNQGPFSAWPELADATKEDRVRQGYSENDPGLRNGEMRASIEHKVIGHEGHVGSDDDKLLWFELGTDKQPARSVLGGSAFELEPKIREETGIGFVAVLSGGKTKVAVR